MILPKTVREIIKRDTKCNWGGFYSFSYFEGFLIRKTVTPHVVMGSMDGSWSKTMEPETHYEIIYPQMELISNNPKQSLKDMFESGRKIKFNINWIKKILENGGFLNLSK